LLDVFGTVSLMRYSTYASTAPTSRHQTILIQF